MSIRLQAQEIIESLAINHCAQLFKGYGVELVRIEEPPPDGRPLLYCGVIGFSGESIRGSLALAGSRGMLSASNPLPGGGSRDWAGELANQIMGQVKGHLLGFDVTVYLATPAVLRGEHLSLDTRADTRPSLFTDAANEGLLGLWVDIETEAEFRMSAEQDAGKRSLEGGTCLFF